MWTQTERGECRGKADTEIGVMQLRAKQETPIAGNHQPGERQGRVFLQKKTTLILAF